MQLSKLTKDRAKLKRKGGGVRVPEKSGVAAAQLSLPVSQTEVASGFNLIAEKSGSVPLRHGDKSGPNLSILTQTEAVNTSPKSPSLARGENIRRLQSTWSNHGPLGVQSAHKPQIVSPSPGLHLPNTIPEEPKLTRQALPGLAKEQTVTSSPSPSLPMTPPLTTRQERKSSLSPTRHARIPSTGNRPTVMDVAQTFHDTPPTSPSISIIKTTPFSAPPASPVSFRPAFTDEHDDDVRTAADPGGWGEDERTITPAVLKAERRRSTMEKYSNFVLPVVEEEKTPVSTPASTLNKVDPSAIEAANEGLPIVEKGVVLEETVSRTEEGGIPSKICVGV